MAVTREAEVAAAHACGSVVHVLVADALTVAESKALRKEMKAAEAEAAEVEEAESVVESHVNDIFAGLFATMFPQHNADGEADTDM